MYIVSQHSESSSVYKTRVVEAMVEAMASYYAAIYDLELEHCSASGIVESCKQFALAQKF